MALNRAEPAPLARRTELRVDALTGATVAFVASRQDRPDQPTTDCPFCVGGLDAPAPYETRAFVNRWPSFPDERCEVVLYSPDHDASLWSIGPSGARRVIDLWAERTLALGGRADIDYVLVFENRGAEVGATIAHPHGQIFAYDRVPPTPAAELDRTAIGACPLCVEGASERMIAEVGQWRAWVPHAAAHPYSLVLAPRDHEPDLPGLDGDSRDDLAALLVDVLHRLDGLWARPVPSMLWFHQRPTDGGAWPQAHVHCEVAVPLRGPGTLRHVAAGELGGGVLINPVLPEHAAAELRAVTW